MFFKQFFKNKTESEIKEEVKKEGFNPIRISNEAGFVYSKHQHPETKLLVFLKGEMEVTVDDKTYNCKPGDKLIILGNTIHSGIVGENGCDFLWSEKIL